MPAMAIPLSHWASLRGKHACVKLLIDAGADLNVRNSEGDTALILASCAGKPECVKLLIDAGADLNARTKKGKTALHFASRLGYTECVQLLVAAKQKVAEEATKKKVANQEEDTDPRGILWNGEKTGRWREKQETTDKKAKSYKYGDRVKVWLYQHQTWRIGKIIFASDNQCSSRWNEWCVKLRNGDMQWVKENSICRT